MPILDRIRAWFDSLWQEDEELITETKDEPTLNKTIPPMVNTITLSSDMETLYLIDNGRAIEFDLSSSKGILVGTLNGQLTVATAPNGSSDGNDDSGMETATAPPTSGGGTGSRGSVKVSVKNSQWTATYYIKSQSLYFIGATEIDIGEPAARGDEPTPKVFAFNLRENVINIFRIGNAIGIDVVPK